MDMFGITEALSKCIIRPPRAKYCQFDLGPRFFQLNSKNYYRQDFQLVNGNNYTIQCSLYSLVRSEDLNQEKPRPLLIFLHANSASRLSVKNYLKDFLPRFDVLGFDFAGSGLSGGKWTTLGYHEKQDLKLVIDFVIDSSNLTSHKRIKTKLNVKQIILWGRSMGAVTSIIFMAKYHQSMKSIVKAMILDSPFSDLKTLVTQLADNYLPIVPNFIVNSMIDKIQQKITEILYSKDQQNSLETQQIDINRQVKRQKLNTFKQNRQQFLIENLSPIECIANIKVPMFFIAGKDDQLVSHKHTIALYEKARTIKQIQLIQGGHNDARPDHLKNSIMDFLQTKLNKQEQLQKDITNQNKNRDWFKNKNKNAQIQAQAAVYKQNEQIDYAKNLSTHRNHSQSQLLTRQLSKERYKDRNQQHQNLFYRNSQQTRPQEQQRSYKSKNNVQYVKLIDIKNQKDLRGEKRQILQQLLARKQAFNQCQYARQSLHRNNNKIKQFNPQVKLTTSIIQGDRNQDKIKQIKQTEQQNQANLQKRRKIFISPKTKAIAKCVSYQQQDKHQAFGHFQRKKVEIYNINQPNKHQSFMQQNKQNVQMIYPTKQMAIDRLISKKNNQNFSSQILNKKQFKLSDVEQSKSIWFEKYEKERQRKRIFKSTISQNQKVFNNF